MIETKHTKFKMRAAALAVASCMSFVPLLAEAAGLGKLTVLSGLGSRCAPNSILAQRRMNWPG